MRETERSLDPITAVPALQYWPGVHDMQAFAVSAVAFLHGGLPNLEGGFLGVDILVSTNSFGPVRIEGLAHLFAQELQYTREDLHAVTSKPTTILHNLLSEAVFIDLKAMLCPALPCPLFTPLDALTSYHGGHLDVGRRRVSGQIGIFLNSAGAFVPQRG